VQVKRTICTAAHAAAALTVAAFFFGSLNLAFAVTPPHIPDSNSTASCAMCHRVHSATTSLPFRSDESTVTTGTALLIAPDPTRGDVSLCLACHGVGQLGSNVDVETAFSRASVHSLAPTESPYGPSPIVCSSCHDPHGTDRAPGGAPWPRLLRSYSLESTTPVFTGEAYCATCHTVQPGEVWDGLDVYLRTGHYTGIPMPGTGTGIRCSICHDPHGSDVAPLLASSLVPTSVVTTFAVTADDRTFCIACHTGTQATWAGGSAYATSAHALSSKTETITARWVPAGQRKVGECQVCHAAMGRSDGDGGTIPKLLVAKGRILCDGCHFEGPHDVASTDTSSQARPVSGALTLATVFRPASGTAGLVALYGRDHSSDTTLSGPREYAPASGTGPSAVGDVDGDGKAELVVASSDATLTVYQPDPLTGLGSVPATYAIPAPAKAIAIADIVDAIGYSGMAEIAVVDGAGTLRVYDVSGATLIPVTGPFTVGAGPWGIATGDAAGTGLPDLVVTDAGGAAVYLVTDDGVHGATVTSAPVGVSPVAPAIGNALSAVAGNEIVVCDAGSATSTVRVLGGSLVEIAGYNVLSGSGKPTASAIGDVLWSVPTAGRSEVSVAFSDTSGDSSVVVVPQLASGSDLDPASTVERVTGAGAHTGSLITGDVDGDGHSELIAGNGGTWDNVGLLWTAPAVQIWHANVAGSSLRAAAESHSGGGAELAGDAPALALADLGPVFPSRHPMDEAAVTHVSTETASVGRHVTCSDCHDSHQAVASLTSAPAVQGLLKGARGVAVSYSGGLPSFGSPGASATSNGVCFRCHSSYTALGGRPDTAVQFDPANASLHSVSQASTSDVPAATFVGASGWTSASVLYCTDCHGDDGRTGTQARGLHESDSAPILGAPYLGADPADPDALCFRCHSYGVYATGTADGPGMSFFQTAETTPKLLHSTHLAGTGGHGLSCESCHVSHGSVTQPHLLRDDIGFTSTGPHSGSCTNGCHAGGGTHVWP
jgi:hypothetical protein